MVTGRTRDIGHRKILNILHSIAETALGSTVTADIALRHQVNEIGWQQKLVAALQAELFVEITVEEVESAASLVELSKLVESRLDRDVAGRSIVDIYADVERIVREELSHDVNYHWHATWLGDVLNKTDSLEDVEIVIRMEEEFGLSISDRDAQQMRTVAQTVQYLWRKIRERDNVSKH